VLAHEEGTILGGNTVRAAERAIQIRINPYPGGTIGVPGWDVFATSGNLKPTTDTDIMG